MAQLSRVYSTEVSREEYWTYTTESAEKAKVQAYKLKVRRYPQSHCHDRTGEQESKAA
jgi:hypothetical protein